MKLVPWAILLIVVLVVVFAGYQIWKSIFPLRPTFSAHPDYGSARINEAAQEPLAINFELLLNSNIGGGVYQFHTDEPQLVTHLRRENE